MLLCLSVVPAVMAGKKTLVNINTATASALDYHLKGIGPKKARAIVQYRQQNGPFKTLDDLDHVKGIGKKTIERNRDRISLGKI